MNQGTNSQAGSQQWLIAKKCPWTKFWPLAARPMPAVATSSRPPQNRRPLRQIPQRRKKLWQRKPSRRRPRRQRFASGFRPQAGHVGRGYVGRGACQARAARSPRNRRQKTAMANHRRRRRNPPARARRRLPWPTFLPRRGLRNLAGRRPRRKRRPLRWPSQRPRRPRQRLHQRRRLKQRRSVDRETRKAFWRRADANRVRCRRPRPPPRQVRQKKTRPRRRSTNCSRCPRSRPMPSRWRRLRGRKGKSPRVFHRVSGFVPGGGLHVAGADESALGSVLRFMFPNILTEPPTSFKVGPPSNFALGMVETKFKVQFGVWIVNTIYQGQQIIFALKSVCTHLGCTPNWLEAEQKFKCPCHGSGFYKDGVNFEGPAPRPLGRAMPFSLPVTGSCRLIRAAPFRKKRGSGRIPHRQCWCDASAGRRRPSHASRKHCSHGFGPEPRPAMRLFGHVAACHGRRACPLWLPSAAGILSHHSHHRT